MNNDRLKFRVRDNQKKEYVKHHSPNMFPFIGEYGVLTFIDANGDKYTNQERYVVEMCTGLKDKNGKLVHENDLLISGYKDEAGKKEVFQVVWERGSFRLKRRRLVINNGFDVGLMMVELKDMTMVGDIHDI